MKNNMKNKFNIGDTVKIIKSGFGCSGDDLGKNVKISEIFLFNEYAYKTNPELGTKYRGHDNIISEESFELVSPKWLSFFRGLFRLPIKRKFKYKVGDIVKIEYSGWGFPEEMINKIVVIKELLDQEIYVINTNGYRVATIEEPDKILDFIGCESSFIKKLKP